MISSTHKAALRVLAALLSNTDWRLVGGTNLALQGVRVPAKDVDIQIRKSDVDRVNELLSSYCTEPITYSESPFFKSYFGKFLIHGVKVEVMADLQYIAPDATHRTDIFSSKPVHLKLGDFSIPSASLQAEYDSYVALGRKDKAKLIKSAMTD